MSNVQTLTTTREKEAQKQDKAIFGNLADLFTGNFEVAKQHMKQFNQGVAAISGLRGRDAEVKRFKDYLEQAMKEESQGLLQSSRAYYARAWAVHSELMTLGYAGNNAIA